MCGIVAYFGGAGNNLTRILTAMSAIIYRAPDSTGVGFPGDDANSIRIHQQIGWLFSPRERMIRQRGNSSNVF